MRELTELEASEIHGGGALGNALGMVIGGLVTAVAAMAATGGTALAAVGVVSAGALGALAGAWVDGIIGVAAVASASGVGASIGSVIQDAITR